MSTQPVIDNRQPGRFSHWYALDKSNTVHAMPAPRRGVSLTRAKCGAHTSGGCFSPWSPHFNNNPLCEDGCFIAAKETP